MRNVRFKMNQYTKFNFIISSLTSYFNHLQSQVVSFPEKFLFIAFYWPISSITSYFLQFTQLSIASNWILQFLINLSRLFLSFRELFTGLYSFILTKYSNQFNVHSIQFPQSSFSLISLPSSYLSVLLLPPSIRYFNSLSNQYQLSSFIS